MTIQLLDLVAQYQTIKPEIDAAIQGVLESGGFILGPNVSGLEQEVAAYLGVGPRRRRGVGDRCPGAGPACAENRPRRRGDRPGLYLLCHLRGGLSCGGHPGDRGCERRHLRHRRGPDRRPHHPPHQGHHPGPSLRPPGGHGPHHGPGGGERHFCGGRLRPGHGGPLSPRRRHVGPTSGPSATSAA